MKANELMIGDWVLHHNDGCIDAMNDTAPYDEAIRIEQSDFELDECFWGRLDPIPLTPEILEKNGFECRGAWMIPGEDFGLRQDGNSWGVLPYYADYNALALCHIAYLHELQHLLHLCGIDKEITI